MGRQWFASSVRGLGVAASLALSILTVAVAPASDGIRTGAPSAGAPSAEKNELDEKFLLLPAYDLDWVNPIKDVRVGDTLVAKISGDQEKKLSKDLKLRMPSGNEEASDLGFDVDEGLSQSGDELRVRFTALKPGRVTVPSMALVDSSGKAVARTNPLSFEVASAIPKDDPKPKDSEPPRPPVSLGLPVATLIAIGLLALVLVAAGVAWLVRWSRRKRQSIPAPAEPPKPEDEVALNALAELEKRGLLRSGQFKSHYFALSEIVKHYVGARFDFDAAESTTYEMISRLETQPTLSQKKTSSELLDALREMFDKLDRVKFTDYVPVAVEGTELLEDAKKWIIHTRRESPSAPR